MFKGVATTPCVSLVITVVQGHVKLPEILLLVVRRNLRLAFDQPRLEQGNEFS